MEAEARFRAMGTDVHVLVVGGRHGLVVEAGSFLLDLERRWSRFRPDSEISRVNRLAGMPVEVSIDTLVLVERALEGARVTGGRFDPTVLGAVLRAGYDRSFEQLIDDAPPNDSPLVFGWQGIVVDPVASTVMLPPGVGFDPGGIGKGYAADLMVRDLLAAGAAGACVSVGGDLRAEGLGLGDGEGWTIAVEHPLRRDPAALIGLRSGAVATSTRAKRAWGPLRDRRHHLIDPATGRPARSGLLSATAVADEAWQAEVLAKAAFVAGPSEGLDLLASIGSRGLVIDDRGLVHRGAGFDDFESDRGTADLVAAGGVR